MKVSLFLATTVNGFIAKIDDNSGWVSEVDNKIFLKMLNQAGGMIVGRKTFDMFEGEGYPVKDILNIVLTQKIPETNKYTNVIYVDNQLRAIDVAAKSGLSEVIIVGGSQTAALFFSENLIDDIYLDVHPLIFGQGIPAIAANNKEFQLKLLESTPLSADQILLHYQVIK